MKRLASALMVAATLGGLTVGTVAVTAVTTPAPAQATVSNLTVKPFKTPLIDRRGCAAYRSVNSRGQVSWIYICR